MGLTAASGGAGLATVTLVMIKIAFYRTYMNARTQYIQTGLEVIKLEFILKLKIKCNDWLLADTCPQAANHCALF